jgi:hypothetical protein
MKYDQLGVAYTSTNELCELLYQNPDLDISHIFVEDPFKYNDSVKDFYADFPMLEQYVNQDITVEQFDQSNQARWLMPDKYRDMDIAKWLLDQCQTREEFQRVGKE